MDLAPSHLLWTWVFQLPCLSSVNCWVPLILRFQADFHSAFSVLWLWVLVDKNTQGSTVLTFASRAPPPIPPESWCSLNMISGQTPDSETQASKIADLSCYSYVFQPKWTLVSSRTLMCSYPLPPCISFVLVQSTVGVGNVIIMYVI